MKETDGDKRFKLLNTEAEVIPRYNSVESTFRDRGLAQFCKYFFNKMLVINKIELYTETVYHDTSLIYVMVISM